MRILVIGGAGQLGTDLARNAGSAHVIRPNRDELDLSKPDQVRVALESYRPQVVINCAAFHNVPLCESEPDQAFRINCVAVRDLAAACRTSNTTLITFSSDYVFGGDKRTPYAEEDRPQPLQIYGMSRLAGEYAALATAPDNAIVIRTCGLYGAAGARSKGGNFVDGRVADAHRLDSIEMASEQVVSPTSTADLSRAVLSLAYAPGRTPGIYHLVNEGQCSWYELTVAIMEILRLPMRVIPIDRGGRTGAMRRPLYSALANIKGSRLGIVLPHWRDALERYLRSKYA